MMRSLLMGTAAGAVGTVALNIATYADMVLRGRPESQVPAKVAGRITQMAGVSLSAGQNGDSGQGGQAQSQGGQSQKGQDKTAQHRQSGLGALMGYAVGLGVGTSYGLLRPLLGRLPIPLAGAILGAAAMAASDVPAVRLGVTDPKEWGAAGWASDILPHLIYGLLTAVAYDAFTAYDR